jgi:uncharacterized protein with NRDE domain
MCTLILGRDVFAPRTMLLAANRDEDPARPSDPPGVLSQAPRVVGGRDRVAGGTWLAVREGRAALALLNRRDRTGQPAPASGRSRGLLVLEAAVAEEAPLSEPLAGGPRSAMPATASGWSGLARATLSRAVASLELAHYAPFSLVFASIDDCWLLTVEADRIQCDEIPRGWHVLTHAELDDGAEPRTAWLMGELAAFRPAREDQAIPRLMALLRSHGGADGEGSAPAVCLHRGRMVTVSSSIVSLSASGARYLHAEGRPCEHEFEERAELVAHATTPDARASRRPSRAHP